MFSSANQSKCVIHPWGWGGDFKSDICVWYQVPSTNVSRPCLHHQPIHLLILCLLRTSSDGFFLRLQQFGNPFAILSLSIAFAIQLFAITLACGKCLRYMYDNSTPGFIPIEGFNLVF